MSLLRLSLTTAIVLCVPLYAQAAVDDAGAQVLTQQLTESMKSFPPIQPNGDVVVKPDGDAFAVTLPVLSFKDPEGKFSAVVPSIALRMTPVSETNYKYVATLPSPFLTLNDPTGVPRGNVTAAQQQLTGEWDSKNHVFPNSVSVLRDVRFTDVKEEVTATIAEMGAVNQLAPNASGRIDGNGSFNMRGLHVVFTSGRDGRSAQVKLEALGLTSEIRDFDLAAITEVQKEASQLGADPAAKPAEMLSRLGSLLSRIPQNSGSGSTKMSLVLNGLDVIAGRVADPKPVHIALPLLKLTASSDTGDTKLTNLSMQYEHAGLAASPLPSSVFADLLPVAVKLDGSVANLPLSELARTAGDAVSAAMAPQDEAAAPQAAPAPMDSVNSALALMDKAQTVIKVNQISYNSKAISTMTRGAIKVSQASPIGAVGIIDTRVNGVAELVEKLGQMMNAPASATPQAQPDPMVQNAMMALSMMQMMGQQVPNATPSGLVYKIEFTPTGDIKMNGADLGALAGGMGGGMGGGHGGRHPAMTDE